MMNVLFGLHGGKGLYWRRGGARTSTHSEVIGAGLCVRACILGQANGGPTRLGRRCVKGRELGVYNYGISRPLKKRLRNSQIREKLHHDLLPLSAITGAGGGGPVRAARASPSTAWLPRPSGAAAPRGRGRVRGKG